MAKVILVYGSTTGNTENVSKSVAEGLRASGADVTVKNVTEAKAGELKDYDLILLGSSTWGLGELQDDFVEFEKNLKDLDLNGKKAAVFGCGNSQNFPDTFCKAVDILKKDLEDCGAEIIIDSLNIDGDVESKLDEVKEWSMTLVQRL